MKHLFLLIALCVCPLFAENQELGNINFPATVSPKLHPRFIHAVLLLHSFNYTEARALFLELQKEDPEFALAYWGEAMTYNHPLWNQLDLEAARHALNKLAPTPEEREAKAPTPKEKGWIHAINLLFGEGDKKQRDWNYALDMCQFYLKNPNDDEIGAFYALSLLGKDQGVRHFSEFMKAAGVANDIFIRNPQHPGASHYMIHSVDDVIHAPLGLNAAVAYSKIAPSSAHALHMSSHIFLALGMWKDVVTSNEAAWQAGLDKMKKNGDTIRDLEIHDLHALQWLHFGQVQQGNEKEAYPLLKTMYDMTQTVQSPMFKWYYAMMRAAHMVNLEQWNVDLLPPVAMQNVEFSAVASDLYANAMQQLLYQKQPIDDRIAELQKLLETEKEKLKAQKEPGKDFFVGVYQDGIDAAEVILLQMSALNHKAKGNSSQTQQLLEKAVLAEESIPVGYGPPIPPKPSRELLGEFFLERDQLQEACQQFADELNQLPKRWVALQKVKILQEKDPSCQLKRTLFFQRLMAE